MLQLYIIGKISICETYKKPQKNIFSSFFLLSLRSKGGCAEMKKFARSSTLLHCLIFFLFKPFLLPLSFAFFFFLHLSTWNEFMEQFSINVPSDVQAWQTQTPTKRRGDREWEKCIDSDVLKIYEIEWIATQHAYANNNWKYIY